MTRQRSAVLLDWRGSDRERHLYRQLFRLMSVARAPHSLLLHAPGGELGGLDRLSGIQMVQPFNLLDRDAIRAVDDWTVNTVDELLSGSARELFPSYCGVHLGDLNRPSLEVDFQTIATITAAMRGLERQDTGTTRWTLLGCDCDMLFAAESAARNAGQPARVWPPRFVAALRDAGATHRGSGAAIPVTHEWRVPRANVLMVSWTRPMYDMFAAVEEQLAGHGVEPSLRVHFGGEAAHHESPAGVTVIGAPRPEEFGRITPLPFADSFEGLSGTAFDIDDGRFARKRLASIRRNVGRQMAFIDAVSRLLDVAQPRVVAVGNDRWWVGQAVVRLARLRGIETVCLQDGVASDSIYWRWLSADRLLANGTQIRDLLLRNGIDAERVVVTGQPRYDKLPEFAGPAITQLMRSRLHLPADRQLVLFTTQYDQDPGFVEGIVHGCMQSPNVHLMLRPHPSEQIALHERLVQQNPDRISLCRHEPIETLVAACDVLVAKSSTTILEAAMLGKQVVVVHDRGSPLLPHAAAINPILLSAAAELPDVLHGLREGQSAIDPRIARAAFEYYCGPFDGKSSERVAAQFALAAQRESRGGEVLPPSTT